jgi:hypothetical protein
MWERDFFEKDDGHGIARPLVVLHSDRLCLYSIILLFSAPGSFMIFLYFSLF